MNSPLSDAKSLFLEAVEKFSADQWPAFLDRACADDVKLRCRIEALLDAHTGNDSLLDGPGLNPAVTLQPLLEDVGSKSKHITPIHNCNLLPYQTRSS